MGFFPRGFGKKVLGTAPNFSGTFGDLATRGRPILLSPAFYKGMLQLLVAALTLRSPQVLRMRDATTKQEIALVGTVHYNPASVERSKEEVTLSLDRNEKVGAVVVESCASRWGRSLELSPPGSLIAKLTQSEMQSAAGVALQSNVPIMLGDADAGAFLPRVKELGKQTVRELADPLSGGWASVYRDFARTLPGTLFPDDVAKSDLLLEGEEPIGLQDFARKEVLIGFLFSLVRYPLAFALKAPLPFAGFATFIVALDSTASQLDAAAEVSMAAGDVFSLPIVATLVFSTLTFGLSVLTSRLLLVAFLEERNAELARSIRRAAAETDGPVVAILGGLHVNGVARLLMSEATPDADTAAYNRDADGVWWEVPAGLDVRKWVS